MFVHNQRGRGDANRAYTQSDSPVQNRGTKSDVYSCLASLWLTCVGLEAWVTLQKSKTAVKALLRDITVSDHQPSAIFPKVSFHLLLLVSDIITFCVSPR